jgi:hypothetical protein
MDNSRNALIVHLNHPGPTLSESGFLQQFVDGMRPFSGPHITFHVTAFAFFAYHDDGTVRAGVECLCQVQDVQFSGTGQRDHFNFIILPGTAAHQFFLIVARRTMKEIYSRNVVIQSRPPLPVVNGAASVTLPKHADSFSSLCTGILLFISCSAG